MKQKKAFAIVIVVLFIAVVVTAVFVYILNRDRAKTEEPIEVTKVQEILLRDLDKNYPPTPREVLRFYLDATNCFYNEEYSEEEFLKLANKVQEVYDDELNANMTEEDYLADLRMEVENFETLNIVVSSYSVTSATDVDYFSQDGYSWARLYCNYLLRQGTELLNSEEVFILRKDADGHWKIYGWQLVEEDQKTESQDE